MTLGNKIVFVGDLDANYDLEECFEVGKGIVDGLLGENIGKLIDRKEQENPYEAPEKSELENLLSNIEEFTFDI
jgi:hypothetical protein